MSLSVLCCYVSPASPLKVRTSSLNILPQKCREPGRRADAGGHLKLCRRLCSSRSWEPEGRVSFTDEE